jgi:hypothetical protein
MNGRKPGGLSFRAAPPRRDDLPRSPRCLTCTIALSLALWAIGMLAVIHLYARIFP